MAIGARNITTTGQIGDGREAAAVQYVLAHARPGDVDDAIATIDRFAYEKSFLINVGDEKGRILDAAVQRADPDLALELGTYCGYSALRIARAAPRATRLMASVEADRQVIERSATTSAGSPPGTERSMMFGGVRTASHALAAPRSQGRARSPCRTNRSRPPDLPAVARRVAVVSGMQQLAGEAVHPGPLGNGWRVLVSGRDDDLTRVDICGGGPQMPPARLSVDAMDLGAQPQLDAGFVGVPVRSATTGRGWGTSASPRYRRFGRCENGRPVAEPVVRPPGRTHRLGTVDQHGRTPRHQT